MEKEKKVEITSNLYRANTIHFISEVATFWCFQAKKTKHKDDQKSYVSLIKRVRAQCYIFLMSSVWVAAVR